MAVIIEPKRRLRLPSGDLPEPKVVHSRSWLPFAVVAWLATVFVGHGILYGWLPLLKGRPASTSLPEAPTVTTIASGAITTPSVLPPDVSMAAPQPTQPVEPLVIEPEQLPACDKIADPESNPDEQVEPLAIDLSRTPFGALLDTRYWTKPCRAVHPIRVHLCVAVKAGRLLAATATTDPSDTSTSRCIIRAASKLPLEPEASLRKVHLTIDLPADNGR